MLLRLAGLTAAAVGLTDALMALRKGVAHQFDDSVQALFHDDEIDGPLPSRARVFALVLEAERHVVTARVSGFDDVDTVGIESVGEVADVGEQVSAPVQPRRPERQLAMLAVRLEMAAVYLKLVGG